MDPNNKVLVLPNICGIEIDLTGNIQPSINPSLQPFYNTYVQNGAPKQAYTTPTKINIGESATEGRAGLIYTQTLSFEFPSNDPLRVARINEYIRAKYIYIKLSTGMVFFFGRNDYFQNATPKVRLSSDEKTTQVSYTQRSIFPLGFTNGSFDFQLSEDFPVNFYNL